MKKKNVIIFPPNSCIWQQAFPAAIFADNLKKINFNVEYFLLKNSPADFGIHSKKLFTKFNTKYCEKCKNKKNLLLKSFGFKHHYLEDYLLDSDFLDISRILESAKNKKPEQIYNLKYKGIEVGKFSSYECLLNFKKKNIAEFSKTQKNKYLEEFKYCLIVISSFYNFFSKYKVDYVVIYNSYYGKNRCLKFLAKKFNIKTIAIHAGNNRSIVFSSLLSTKMDLLEYTASLHHKFIKFVSNLKSIKLLLKHFSSLLSAKSSFSWSAAIRKNFNVKNYFEIKESQKIILLALSSPDEKIASKAVGAQGAEVSNKDFRNQESLIKFIVKYIAKKENIFLIIRVHPRELGKKDHKEISTNYFKLKKICSEIKKKYKNIKFNFPEEKISFYNIVSQVDLLVSEGSTVNIETSFFGLPCVLPRGIYPDIPKNLVNIARNKKHFCQLIDKCLNKEIDPKIIIKTFRYFSVLQDYTTFKFPFLTAPNSNSFLERVSRYIFLNYFYGSYLDIIFYKLKNFKNEITIKFRKNFNTSSFSYFEFTPVDLIDVKSEQKIVLENLKLFLLKNSLLKVSNSKLSRFFKKI